MAMPGPHRFPANPSSAALMRRPLGKVATDPKTVTGLTADDVAAMLKVSRSTVLRRTVEGVIPATKGPHGEYRYDPDLIAMVEVRHQVPVSALDKERATGKRDALVIAALEKGASVSDIVTKEEISIHIVLQLRQAWLEGRKVDQEGVVSCRCGKPSDPRTAQCASCYARSRVLQPDQRIVTVPSKLEPITIDGVTYIPEDRVISWE